MTSKTQTVDRETVERLADEFLSTIHTFQKSHSGMNFELLNAIAVGAAVVLAAVDGERGERAREWFLVALDQQIADFREEFSADQAVRGP